MVQNWSFGLAVLALHAKIEMQLEEQYLMGFMWTYSFSRRIARTKCLIQIPSYWCSVWIPAISHGMGNKS